MLLKAGTYRWNDVINFNTYVEECCSINLIANVSLDGSTYVDVECVEILIYNLESTNTRGIAYNFVSMTPDLSSSMGITLPVLFDVYKDGGGLYEHRWNGYGFQTLTILVDTNVNETFGNLFISNTNYNEVNPITFSTIISKLQSLIDSANAKTGNSDTDLTNAVDNLISGYGTGGGECSGEHIIEVDELPDVGEEGGIYTLSPRFNDVIICMPPTVISYREMLSAEGGAGGFYTIPTKTTENIMISSESGMYFYFVEDENDIFICGDFGAGTNEWYSVSLLMDGLSYGGQIDDISEATSMGYYSLIASDGKFYKYNNGEYVEYSETIEKQLEFTSNGDGTCYVSGRGNCSYDIIIPSTSPNGDIVTSIGNSAFSGYSSLVTIKIPDSVTSIGIEAFRGCTALTGVTLSSNLTSIGTRAFHNCTALTEITIPNSVTYIGQTAFYGCNSLTAFTFPTGLTNLDTTLLSCRAIESVTIPNTVTSISGRLFGYCTALTNITFEGTVEQWGGITLDNEWNYYATATQVNCTDGVVSLPENPFTTWVFADVVARITIGSSQTNYQISKAQLNTHFIEVEELPTENIQVSIPSGAEIPSFYYYIKSKKTVYCYIDGAWEEKTIAGEVSSITEIPKADAFYVLRADPKSLWHTHDYNNWQYSN